jgi:predicted nucleic acid-binding protein
MAGAVFVDTWGWIALGHRRDARHHEIKQFYQGLRQLGTRIYTTDYVLDETVTLLFRREPVAEAVRYLEALLAAADQGYLRIERITSARFAQAWALRRRFTDKPLISFTDLTSMALMKELGLTQILTEDDHFHHVGMGFQKVP